MNTEQWIVYISGIVTTLLLCGTMILFGWIFQNRPPQDINSLYGYRTARSMKTPETWEFAHQYCGRLWWRLGWISLAASAALHVLFLFVSWMEIGVCVLMFLQIIPLVWAIFPTEKALKKKFDQFGRLKE